MDRGHLIDITSALYRVTGIFPRGETLKWALRDKANDILAGGILIFSKNPVKLTTEEKKKIYREILKNIEILEGYFEVAKRQNWVDKRNFFVLGKEYKILQKEFDNLDFGEKLKEREGLATKNEKTSYNKNKQSNNERIKKILEVLKEKDKAQVWEFKNIFPEVTKRTLRRDFEYLFNKGLVERVGEGKYTFYRIKDV